MNKMIILVVAIFFILLQAVFAMPENERVAAFHMAINKSDILVRQGKYVEALAAAEDASRLDSSDYEGLYYQAFCLLKLEMYDQAESKAKGALEKVPEDSKPVVEKLLSAIAQRKQFAEKIAAADASVSEGLKTKAAAAYTEAWKLDPSREDTGIKAADLWCSMKEYVNCTRILRSMSGKETEASLKAEAMYKTFEPTLYEFARQETETGWHILEGVTVIEGKVEPKPNFEKVTDDELNEAVYHFNRAADTLPERNETAPLYTVDMPHVGLAMIAAYRNDLDGAALALRRGIKEHHLLILPTTRGYFDTPRKYHENSHPHEPRRADYWAPLLCTSDFQDFLLDAFGTGVVELARDVCRSR